MEDKIAENTRSQQQKENRIQKNEDSLRGLWDNFKHTHIHILGCWKEKRAQGVENLFEKIILENVPKLVQKIDIRVRDV